MNYSTRWVAIVVSPQAFFATSLLIFCHVNISFVFPFVTAWVLDDRVVVDGFGSGIWVTNSENTIIESNWRAHFVVIDTFLVQLEWSQVSINGDRDWTNGGDSGFESTFVLVFDDIACRDCYWVKRRSLNRSRLELLALDHLFVLTLS